MNPASKGSLYFIGAGPGDPDLISVKGQKLLAEADLVLYAGSLVSPGLIKQTRPGAALYDSAGMKLETQLALMIDAVRSGLKVVRLHTGDPAIFGAIHEQMAVLREAGISFELVPGISSVFAAAAALGLEYTLPEITQTLILTRAAGRTPVPQAERLRDLARHRSSLAIFLSTGMVLKVVDELSAAGYAPETPIALVYRASWPDQKVVRGTLADIGSRLETEELTHQGLIIVSPALSEKQVSPSHLYGAFQEPPPRRPGLAILALTEPAQRLARALSRVLPEAQVYLPLRFLSAEEQNDPRFHGFEQSIRQVLQEAFVTYESLVCIMASGIVVRELAPLLNNKHSDPAVVLMDPHGKFAVSLLSGHAGGANRLAGQLAALTGGQAVITTASDALGQPALDVLAQKEGWKLDGRSLLPQIMAALVNGESPALVVDAGLPVPDEIKALPLAAVFHDWPSAVRAGHSRLLLLTCRRVDEALWAAAPLSVVFYLPLLALGVGCNRGTGADEIEAALNEVLALNALARESVFTLASIEDKAAEPGLLQVCARQNWPFKVFSRRQVNTLPALPNPSPAALKALGVTGVAEPAALLAAGAPALLVEKQKFPNVTVAVALRKENI
ncbi:MAG: precorrin-4 C(11)-methyltransferase [Anaerolineae bacterium]|nr:precorrin-4 C(11)-methyltransferase [Anaerolineae bacterium]